MVSRLCSQRRYRPNQRLTPPNRTLSFPTVARRDVAQRYERVLCVERGAERPADVPGFDQIALVNVESGAADHFSYGEGWLVEEHLLIEAPGDSAPQWIAGTALDMRAENTVLSVFDAAHVSDGPIAQARLPYSLPLGLHGTFRSEKARR